MTKAVLEDKTMTVTDFHVYYENEHGDETFMGFNKRKEDAERKADSIRDDYKVNRIVKAVRVTHTTLTEEPC